MIAYARSTDLIHWQVMPPLTQPGDFGKLEVPQLVEIKGHYYLLFCTLSHTTAVHRLSRTGLPGVTGTHYLVADNPLGPFHYPTDHFLVGDELGSLFAGKLIQDPQGHWVFMAWRNVGANGSFLGELSDPFPLEIDQIGHLMVSWIP